MVFIYLNLTHLYLKNIAILKSLLTLFNKKNHTNLATNKLKNGHFVFFSHPKIQNLSKLYFFCKIELAGLKLTFEAKKYRNTKNTRFQLVSNFSIF